MRASLLVLTLGLVSDASPAPMPISYDQFRLLLFAQQLSLIWVKGTYLARRWEEEDAVGLYHLAGGFFTEVYYIREGPQHL